jgi:hypothetical protein
MSAALYIEGHGAITPYASLADFPCGTPGELLKPDLGLLERNLRRGLSDVTRLFMHAAQLALQTSAADPCDVQVVFASAFGELHTAEALMALALDHDGSSPARFRHSVHNSAPGLFSIAVRNTWPSTALSAGRDSVAMGLLESYALLRARERAPQAGPERVLLVFAEEAVPHALSADHSYPGLAVALVLASAPGPRTRATLSLPSRTDSSDRALEDPFAGVDHPLGPAVLLARELEAGRSTRLQVGEGPSPYWVDLRAGAPAPSEEGGT